MDIHITLLKNSPIYSLTFIFHNSWKFTRIASRLTESLFPWLYSIVGFSYGQSHSPVGLPVPVSYQLCQSPTSWPSPGALLLAFVTTIWQKKPFTMAPQLCAARKTRSFSSGRPFLLISFSRSHCPLTVALRVEALGIQSPWVSFCFSGKLGKHLVSVFCCGFNNILQYGETLWSNTKVVSEDGRGRCLIWSDQTHRQRKFLNTSLVLRPFRDLKTNKRKFLKGL